MPALICYQNEILLVCWVRSVVEVAPSHYCHLALLAFSDSLHGQSKYKWFGARYRQYGVHSMIPRGLLFHKLWLQ